MSNYTKATNFATKDTLPTGDSGKIVKGTEIDNEFNAIASAISSKADTASPTFTGTPAAPTAAADTNTTQLATTAFVFAERTNSATITNKTISADSNTLSGLAASSFVLSNSSGNIDGSASQKAIPSGVVVGTTDTQTLTNKTLTSPAISSPAMSGTPTAPTAAAGTNTTQVATTAFVTGAVSDSLTATATLTNKTLTSPTINGGTITGITDLAVADGGTGASTAANARTNLGLGSLAVLSTVGTSEITDAAVTPAKLSQPLTSATAQASTSGTSIDFTSIPSWVKKITVMFSGVSTSGSSDLLIQLGDSGGVETSGYSSLSTSDDVGSNLQSTVSSTSGILLYSRDAAYNRNGVVSFYLVNSSTNTWVASGSVAALQGNPSLVKTAGSKSLSATLDRVRVTTANGTDTFDAGSINIIYE